MHSEQHQDVYESVTAILCDARGGVDNNVLPTNLLLADSPDELLALRAPDKNISIFSWAAPTELREAVASRMPADLITGRWRVPKHASETLLELVDDQVTRSIMAGLLPAIAAYSQLVHGTHLEVSLEHTREQPCPLFHVDRLSYRLLCTFRGPGTQWLDDRFVHRRFLGKGSNQRIVRYGANIYEVDRFDVCVLKGESVPGGYRRGIVHRSPPVSPCDGTRWYLRIDCP